MCGNQLAKVFHKRTQFVERRGIGQPADVNERSIFPGSLGELKVDHFYHLCNSHRIGKRELDAVPWIITNVSERHMPPLENFSSPVTASSLQCRADRDPFGY